MPPENTGIQNVRVRTQAVSGQESTGRSTGTSDQFILRRANQGLQADLLRGRRNRDRDRDESDKVSEIASVAKRFFLEENRISEIFSDIFKNNATTPSNDDLRLLIEDQPKDPPFPYIIFGLALLKDILDPIFTFSVFLIPFVLVTSFLISIILAMWVYGKMSGGWWKKKLIKGLWIRLIPAALVELVPLLSVIPATTIFILMAHNHEKKLVKMFDAFLEELRTSGIKF